MEIENNKIYQTIKEIIVLSKQRVYRMANSALLETYWHIGKIIVEDEQQGKLKATYGDATLKNLANRLTQEFGKGFEYTNLTNMRKFYLSFPNLDTLRQDLSWSHYRLLARLDSAQKRDYYLAESVQNNLNSRQLQRVINSLSFERVVKHLPTAPESHSIQSIIKDPNVFDFLGLPQDAKNSERTIETAIINHLQTFLLEFGNSIRVFNPGDTA
jgi:predicted nuclease of restriction endonuclease-like (RecB) superfamily